MTGARQAMKDAERRRLASVKEAKKRAAATNDYECSTCPDLTRFVVRAPTAVIDEILRMAVEVAASSRPWFSQSSGPVNGETDTYFAIFYAGKEDAKRVKALLEKHQVPEASE